MAFNLSLANDEAAFVTALGAFVGGMLFGHMPAVTSLEYAVLAGLAVVGYTGYNASPPAASAPAASVSTSSAPAA